MNNHGASATARGPERPVKVEKGEEKQVEEPKKENNVPELDSGTEAATIPAAKDTNSAQPGSSGVYSASSAANHDGHDYIIESLQVDTTESDPDLDSTIGDEVPSSSTTSLNSTVTSFRDFCGRRYHAFEESDYWLPNDQEEISRLELQHYIWRISLSGRLNVAPINKDLHRALDVGTGTGRWAVEFAEAHPSCQVVGTDLSPIQPNVVPSNCSFVVDNVEDEWVWNESFDYIHSRMLVLGLKDWKTYFKNCYDHLTPGGWVEAQDTRFPIESANPNCPPDQPLWQWSKLVAQSIQKSGIDPMAVTKFADYMREAGFINIREQPIQWPLGPWPKGNREKLIGRIMIDNVSIVIRPSGAAMFTKFLGWSMEQVDEFVPKVEADITDKVGKYYGLITIVVGQKPEAAALEQQPPPVAS